MVASVTSFLILIALFVNPLAAECISSSKAHLRKGPASRFEKTWTVGRFTPLIRLKRKGSWLQVRDMDRQVHWVHRKLVTKSIRCLMVKASSTAVYKGPGKKFGRSPVGRVERYTALKRLDMREGWYRVQDMFGRRFWVHEDRVWRPLKINKISL